MPIGKTEWEAVKKLYGNRCRLCDRTEKAVGILEKAHIKARSKSGGSYFPLCPNCHYKFDNGKLTVTQLKKLNITEKDYTRLRPKKPKKKDEFDIPWA